MNITIIGLNYAPEDTAIGLYSSQMAEFLAQKHQVEVITAFPYYPQWEIWKDYQNKPLLHSELINGVKVWRSKHYVPTNPGFVKRLLHLNSYLLGSLFNTFKSHKPDAILVITPFLGTIMSAQWLKWIKGGKTWVHVQDFEFDAALQSGILKKDSFPAKLLVNTEKWMYGLADFGSTISFSMMKKFKEKSKAPLIYFPNWIDQDFINPAKANKHPIFQSSKYHILYSGNMGEKQDWNCFVQVATRLQNHSEIEWIVVGDGAKRKEIEESCKNLTNVKFYDPVPYADLNDLLCSADLHILFQKTDVLDTVMPSKLLGMMASAKPSIIVGNELSEVKNVVESSQGAVYFGVSNPDLIADKIVELAENSIQSIQMGQNARKYVIENFSRIQVLTKFQTELENSILKS